MSITWQNDESRLVLDLEAAVLADVAEVRGDRLHAAAGVTRAKRLARRSSRSDHLSRLAARPRAWRVVGGTIWRPRSE
jgi:hypothetical protein